MLTARQQLGQIAEQRAAALVAAAGYRILLRNYRCRLGELDIVARRGPVLALIEVRLRSSMRFGGPAASIHAAKRRRMLCAARHLLLRHPALSRLSARFDAVVMTGEHAPLQWLQHIF